MSSPRLPNQLMYWGSGGKYSVLLLKQLGKEYSDLVEITTYKKILREWNRVF